MKVRPFKMGNMTRWRVDHIDPDTGKRSQPSFPTKSQAEQAARRISEGDRLAGQSFRKLNEREQRQIAHAYRAAKQNGHNLVDLLAEAKTRDPEGNGPKLITVIRKLLKTKEANGRSGEYRSSLQSILIGFAAGIEHRPINRVTVGDIQRFLDSKRIASWPTIRARLSTLFKFSIRMKFRRDNPCEQLEPVSYVKPPPRAFTAKEFKSAWNHLKAKARDGLAWFALSSVCGLRPEEAEKTDEKRDLSFIEGFIRVEAQTTKVRQRRVVYPRAEAMALLYKAIELGGKLPIGHGRRKAIIQDGLRQAVGFEAWPKDITRHTAATYLLADGQTAGEVSEALGNSEKVLKRDYKALKTRKEAVEFWQTVELLAAGKPRKARPARKVLQVQRLRVLSDL